jgi:HlyD family type I secretion membrane fusion protein
LLVVFLGVGGFGFWAATVPLAEAVVASGMIKVDSNRKQVQHLAGGIVKEILVNDGDQVRQGDILLRLDETQAATSLAILRDGYDAAIAQEARLKAERDDSESIVFPEEMTNRHGDPKIREIIKAQSALFQARNSALAGKVQILERQIAHLREDIQGLKAQKSAKSRQLGFVYDELKSMQVLLEKGMTGKQRVLELEREAARLEGEHGEHQSAIAAAKTSISVKELEIYQVEKSFRESLVNELKEVQAEIFDFRERLNSARHVFQQTVVRSPVDGVVVDSGVHTIGGVVNPGETLLEIVPLDDDLIIEARIDPQDLENLKPGLPAAVKITAFKQRETPELAAVLKYLSADALQDQYTGQAYFIARLEVPASELLLLGVNQKLQAGMLADVFIRTGERTALKYLIQPLRDSFRRAWLEK